jgi:hypothetical protein
MEILGNKKFRSIKLMKISLEVSKNGFSFRRSGKIYPEKNVKNSEAF